MAGRKAKLCRDAQIFLILLRAAQRRSAKHPKAGRALKVRGRSAAGACKHDN